MDSETKEHPKQDSGSDAAVRGATALHRKAQAGSAEHRARALTLAKALRLSLAKVAQAQMHLAVAVLAVRIEQVSGEELNEKLNEDHLLMLLDGPGGQRGAALFDGPLVGALIQSQTMGQVLPALEGQDRSLTVTDAAICAPFLNAVIKMAVPMTEVAQEAQMLQGYAFGAHCKGLRLLRIALQAQNYHLVHLTVDVAAGTRQGQIVICTPVSEEEDVPQTKGDTVPDGQAWAGVQGPRTLEPMVMSLLAELRIALARLPLSLRRLGELRVGQALDIGTPKFDEVLVQSCEGRRLGQGSLGQIEGQRAVQVMHKPKSILHPQRRAGDREPLDLQEHQASDDRRAGAFKNLLTNDPSQELLAVDERRDETATPLSAGGLPDLPDMSDLPEFDDIPVLPELPDLTDG